jgi:type II secretory pathway component GspD/PulD (secretin)
LVLGGFISREQSQDIDGLPGLSELPVFGHLFGTNRMHRSQTELAIFVTPIVVDAKNSDLAQRATSASTLLTDSFPEPLRLNHAMRREINPEQKNMFDGQWDDSLPDEPALELMNQWE